MDPKKYTKISISNKSKDFKSILEEFPKFYATKIFYNFFKYENSGKSGD